MIILSMSGLIKQYWEYLGLILISNLILSYSLSYFIPIDKGFSFICSLEIIFGLIYWGRLNYKNKESGTLEDIVETYEKIQNEQLEVIEEYEKIFDSQLVELPCVCGGNTFKGLFSPNTENIVECEKCKSKYRVNISYDSILISEPSGNTMNEMVV